MIQEWLLWFDDSPTRATADKIGNAVARYRQKYGHSPDVCYVHPSAFNETLDVDLAIKVLPAKSVLPYHFWLGVSGVEAADKAPAKKRGKQKSV